MVKYFKELEKPNDFYLHLIEQNWVIESSKGLKDAMVPLEFFDKYSNLFSIINDLYCIVKELDFDIASDKIMMNYKVGLIKYDDTYFISRLESLLYEDFKLIEEKQKPLVVTAHDINGIFRFYQVITSILETIYVNRKKEFCAIRELLEEALTELKKYSIVECEIDNRREIRLPNAWYITPYNDLYNTTDINNMGHKQANLEYPFEEVKNCIKSNITINCSKSYLKNKMRIIKSGYIDEDDYKFALNYTYQPAYLNKELVNKSYDPNIIKIVLGVYSAQAGFYEFFENLQKYTDNPGYELDKIIEMTGGDINDILIRCANFHKMAVCTTKTLATSNPFCSTAFSEYLKRGWDVSYISPIVINKEKRVVEELNSIIIDRCIDKDRESYEKKKQLGYGRIF